MDALANYSRESDDDDDVPAMDSSNGRRLKPEKSRHSDRRPPPSPKKVKAVASLPPGSSSSGSNSGSSDESEDEHRNGKQQQQQQQRRKDSRDGGSDRGGGGSDRGGGAGSDRGGGGSDRGGGGSDRGGDNRDRGSDMEVVVEDDEEEDALNELRNPADVSSEGMKFEGGNERRGHSRHQVSRDSDRRRKIPSSGHDSRDRRKDRRDEDDEDRRRHGKSRRGDHDRGGEGGCSSNRRHDHRSHKSKHVHRRSRSRSRSRDRRRGGHRRHDDGRREEKKHRDKRRKRSRDRRRSHSRSGSSSSRSRSRDRTSRDRSSRDRGGEHFKTGQEKREAKVKKLGMVVADPVTGQGAEVTSNTAGVGPIAAAKAAAAAAAASLAASRIAPAVVHPKPPLIPQGPVVPLMSLETTNEGPIKEGEFGNSAPGGKPSDDITNAIAAATKAAAALAEKTSVITPQAAMEAAMKEMHEKVQAETGIAVPKYYNLTAVNPMKYAEQEQKRKLLWGGKKESKEEPKTTCLGTWKGAKFDDNKQSEKFRKLMGMKGNVAEQAGEGSSTSGTEEVTKKQEELYKNLERQYEISRMQTHTGKGIGLGFGSMHPPPS